MDDFAGHRDELQSDLAVQTMARIAAEPSVTSSSSLRRDTVAVLAAAAAVVLAVVGLLETGPTVPPSGLPRPAPMSQADYVARASAQHAVASRATPGGLAALLSRIDPRPAKGSTEIDERYPLVESVVHPRGTTITFTLGDAETRVAWILTSQGDDIQ